MRLSDMRRKRYGMPSLTQCKPVVVVYDQGNRRGVTAVQYDDIYDALERLDDYPVGSLVVDKADYDAYVKEPRVYAERVSQDYLPMAASQPMAKGVAA